MTRPSSSMPRSWRCRRRCSKRRSIVIIVIFLFLGSLRSTLIPIVTIPLSLIGVMFALLALGYSINLLTLLALVLAIGLVVDDAIVVVENIHRHIEEGIGADRRGACRRARNRRAGHLDDDHARCGLCADRLRLRPDRRAVPRIRLHAGRRGDRVGRHRAHPVADDVLEAAQARSSTPGGFVRVRSTACFEGLTPALRAAPRPHAQLPPGDAADPRRRHRADRHHVCHGARRSWHPRRTRAFSSHGQVAASDQSRLSRAGHRASSTTCSRRPGEGARLHHQWHSATCIRLSSAFCLSRGTSASAPRSRSSRTCSRS